MTDDESKTGRVDEPRMGTDDDPGKAGADAGEEITYEEGSTESTVEGSGDGVERALPAVDGSAGSSGADTDADDTRELGADSSDRPALESAPDQSDRGGEATEPLGDLAEAVDRRRAESSEGDDLFEREDVPRVDGDAVWDRLEREDPRDDPADLEGRERREIPKRSYCHQCEHFAAPPDVACTHEGTEILEMPSLETFRVVDCPVVLEEEKLESGTVTEDRS